MIITVIILTDHHHSNSHDDHNSPHHNDHHHNDSHYHHNSAHHNDHHHHHNNSHNHQNGDHHNEHHHNNSHNHHNSDHHNHHHHTIMPNDHTSDHYNDKHQNNSQLLKAMLFDTFMEYSEFEQLFKSFYIHMRKDLKEIFDRYAILVNSKNTNDQNVDRTWQSMRKMWKGMIYASYQQLQLAKEQESKLKFLIFLY